MTLAIFVLFIKALFLSLDRRLKKNSVFKEFVTDIQLHLV